MVEPDPSFSPETVACMYQWISSSKFVRSISSAVFSFYPSVCICMFRKNSHLLGEEKRSGVIKWIGLLRSQRSTSTTQPRSSSSCQHWQDLLLSNSFYLVDCKLPFALLVVYQSCSALLFVRLLIKGCWFWCSCPPNYMKKISQNLLILIPEVF